MKLTRQVLIFFGSFIILYSLLTSFYAEKVVVSSVPTAIFNSALCFAFVATGVENNLHNLALFLLICVGSVLYVSATDEIFFQIPVMLITLGISIKMGRNVALIMLVTTLLAYSISNEKYPHVLFDTAQTVIGVENTLFYSVTNYLQVPRLEYLMVFLTFFGVTGYFIRSLAPVSGYQEVATKMPAVEAVYH